MVGCELVTAPTGLECTQDMHTGHAGADRSCAAVLPPEGSDSDALHSQRPALALQPHVGARRGPEATPRTAVSPQLYAH